VGYLTTAQFQRRNHRIRAGQQHSVFDAGFLIAGDDLDGGIDFAGGQGDEQVVGVAGERGDNAVGAFNAGLRNTWSVVASPWRALWPAASA